MVLVDSIELEPGRATAELGLDSSGWRRRFRFCCQCASAAL